MKNIIRVVVGIVAIVVTNVVVYRVLPSFGYDIKPAPQDLTATMHAVVYESHGGSEVLRFQEIPRPLANGSFVLIKVLAASLNPCDYKFRRNRVPHVLLPLPKIPGGDIAGIVEYAPQGSKYKIGDRVAALVPLTGTPWGGYAEYYAAQEDFIAHVPDNVTFEHAASLPLVALTTLQGLEDIKSPSNKSILIHAGSGGVGTFAIQWAKYVMKFHTVATTCSARNHKLVEELGADITIDYRTENFTQIIKNYDVVFDPMSFLYEKASLTPGPPPPPPLLHSPYSQLVFPPPLPPPRARHWWYIFIMHKSYDMSQESSDQGGHILTSSALTSN